MIRAIINGKSFLEKVCGVTHPYIIIHLLMYLIIIIVKPSLKGQSSWLSH